MTQTMHKTTVLLFAFICLAIGSGCVYRPSVSQGNLIKQEDLDQVEIAMTRNQVRFLLGSPMIDDPFSRNRWDYVYYLKIGRKEASQKRWVSIFFVDDVVSEIRQNQELSPTL